MATVRKRIQLDAPAHRAWDARRDFHAVHTRLVPGFVVDSTPDGDEVLKATLDALAVVDAR